MFYRGSWLFDTSCPCGLLYLLLSSLSTIHSLQALDICSAWTKETKSKCIMSLWPRWMYNTPHMLAMPYRTSVICWKKIQTVLWLTGWWEHNTHWPWLVRVNANRDEWYRLEIISWNFLHITIVWCMSDLLILYGTPLDASHPLIMTSSQPLQLYLVI